MLQRGVRLVLAGALPGVLERHATADDLYADYPAWINRHDTLDAAARDALREAMSGWRERPLISVIMPAYESSPRLLGAAIASVRAQLYPEWELCIVDDASPSAHVHAMLAEAAAMDPRIRIAARATTGGTAAATRDAVAMAQGRFVAFLDHDDLLAELALYRVVEALQARPALALLYTDEDRIDLAGRRHAPHFKPDWNPDWLLATNYILHLTVVATDRVRAAGAFEARFDGVQDWDLLLRVTESLAPEQVAHVPYVLYHWREHGQSVSTGVYRKAGIEEAQRVALVEAVRRRRLQASVEPSLHGWRLRPALPTPPPLVSIVIPSHERPDLLRRCTDSLFAHTAYAPFEIVVVDHASAQPESLAFLATLRERADVRVVRDDEPFNYARLCNRGVHEASGDVVVLMNNDVEAIQGGWLGELVAQALRPGVGVVGALLYYEDFTIQHAGVLMGVNGTADRPYLGRRRGYPGIAGRAAMVQAVTAVITACAAVRRDTYHRAGGMDEAFAVSHNDLDLCLAVQALGLRNLFTPHAELIHLEGATRGHEDRPAERTRAADEAARFRHKWGARANADPYYNVNLTATGVPFRLAWPPRSEAAREESAAVVVPLMRSRR